jgi:thiol:disulfide interchange protein
MARIALLFCLVTNIAAAQDAPPEVSRPYDEGADAQAQIDAAVVRARRENKHVLLVFGANWCPWCRRLEWVLRNEPNISGAIARGWRVVHVDVGPRRSHRNRAIVERYGNPMQHGLPCLVVLDGQGNLQVVQETSSLENGDRHDPARVLAFLQRWHPN